MSNITTLFIGKSHLHLPLVKSTNLYAQELISKSKPIEGTAISAAHQTQGRGQIGSKWVSEPDKNLIVSVILYPKFLLPTQQFKLSQAVSLAVFHTVAQYIDPAIISIKWPNDIYVRHKKIAGILIQNAVSRKNIQSSIIGLGLNVNQSAFPNDLANPTSLTLETGESFPIKRICSIFFQYLEQFYLKLKNQNWNTLEVQYLKNLYRFGTESQFIINSDSPRIVRGKIMGVSPLGQLRVSINDQEQLFNVKEISFV